MGTARGSQRAHLRVTAEVKFVKRAMGMGGLIKSSAKTVKRLRELGRYSLLRIQSIGGANMHLLVILFNA